MTSRRRFVSSLAAALAAAGLPRLAAAQTIARNARIAVGFPPGGSTDFIARTLAEKLRGGYAPQVLVENRPGAAGRLMLQQLRNAENDGSTLLLSPASMFVVFPHVFRKLGYDPFADFVPVTTLCSFPFGFAVGPAVPENVKTLADFASWAKSSGKPINYGSPGAGSMPHFTALSIVRALGLQATHVGFKGGAPVIQDLVGGHIQAGINVIGEQLPHQRGGRLRILAQTGPTRSPFVPDVPTLAEAGIRDVVAREWFGMWAPAKTPAGAAAAANAALREAIRTKEVISAYAKFAYDPEGESAAEFASRVRGDYDRWAPIVKASGFSSEE